jgi:membrane protease YdiL (CAAX protease family)
LAKQLIYYLQRTFSTDGTCKYGLLCASLTEELPGPKRKNEQTVTWLVLILLLLLRIPYVIAITYFTPIDDQIGGAVYEVSTYLLTCTLIWWEREHLAEFHLDKAALAFIIIFRPLQTLILEYWHVSSPLAFPHPAALLIWAISIGLAGTLYNAGFNAGRFQTRDLAWLGVGLLAGLAVSVCENLQPFRSALGSPHPQSTGFLPMLASTGMIWLYHLGFAPINEEPLFRGFLWGALRRLRWKEIWIWLFQAVVFTLAHIYFAPQHPLLFWLYIPGAALLLGWLAWRSRSIAAGILAHAMINAATYVAVLGLLVLILRIFR